MELRSALLAAALVLGTASSLVAWGLQQKLNTAKAATDLAKSQTEQAQADADRNLDSLNTLKSTLDIERAEQAKLLAFQGQLRQGLDSRERLIENLKDENAELRQWATQPLPDTARRLRERPAFTGADAYRQWLSGSRAMPTTGD
ncbi:hypothetical protein D3C77_203190 [compost metagenome]